MMWILRFADVDEIKYIKEINIKNKKTIEVVGLHEIRPGDFRLKPVRKIRKDTRGLKM